jgi:hypothetical protein
LRLTPFYPVQPLTYIGKLDISSLDLHRVPPEAFQVLLGISSSSLARPVTPEPKDDTVKTVKDSFANIQTGSRREVYGKEQLREEVWVECEEVTLFKAGENKIEKLDIEIGAFGGLKAIDVSPLALSEVGRLISSLDGIY